MQRKEFLKLTALGFATLPFYSFVKQKDDDTIYDVVIIGAGLSGLTAARRLTQANRNVLVMEAQDRVGGRTWSVPVGKNDFIDVGGQWIGKGHDRMYELVKEAGLRTFPTFATGQNILRIDSKNKIYEGDTPPIGLFALLSAQKVLNRVDQVASGLSPDSPWLAPNASELDQIGLESWIDQTITNKKARVFVKRMAEGELCQPLQNVSALQAFVSARATGSLRQAERIEDGALRDRILGGAQGISHFLHQQLQHCVKLSCPVSFVKQEKDYLRVGNEDYSVFSKKVVIALPLPMVRRIQFTPELPREKQILIESMTMGTVVKVHAVYKTPFWRDRGLSGASVCLDEVVELSVDNSVPGSEKGILTSLIHADRAQRLLTLSPSERRTLLLNSYANLFGTSAREPEFFHEYSFSNNPWIGGAYSGYFKSGVFSEYGQHHAKPCGNIYWAGTETSTLFKGFMEGAVLSGERVAREVLG